MRPSVLKRILFTTIICGIAPTLIWAQPPQKINYQAVARNTETGSELTNQEIYLAVKILEGGSNGTIVYQENHPEIQTNTYGLFSIQIGNGNPMTGNFQNISWAQNDFWLEIDIDAGSGLETMAAMQFVSVPYALHAKTAEQIDDADADPENELISDFSFNEDGTELNLIEGGESKSVLMAPYMFDDDADPQNELATGLQLSTIDTTLTLSQPGTNLTENLAFLVDDADPDPDNERIGSFSFNSTNSILSLTEGGLTYSEDLGSLIEDEDWQTTNSENIIFNTTDLVGIGTESPHSTLDIKGSIAHAITKLDNQSGDVSYNVTLSDHIIVCNIGPPGGSDITIIMPDPTEIEGRELIIRKTGQGPYPADVIIDFGGFQLDYSAGGLELDDNNRATATLISIGADGWIRTDE